MPTSIFTSPTNHSYTATDNLVSYAPEESFDPADGAPNAAGSVVLGLPMRAKPQPSRIAIKAQGRILLIDTADVIAVEAKGNCVLIHSASSSLMLRESISTVEAKLHPHGFVRIHRSVLVNAALVEEIHPWTAGEYLLRMKGGKEYTVTRTYKKNLQLLAHSWIGTNGFIAE